MITLFNRKELYAGFSVQQQSKIRDTLAANGIDYNIKVFNQGSVGTRTWTGSAGQNPDFSCEYIIYVHKKNYDRAQYCLKSIR